jgi:alkylated DNA repair dioxygenase AlkB
MTTERDKAEAGEPRRVYDGFTSHDLGDGHLFHVGPLPEPLHADEQGFESLWSMHPDEYHRIMIHGREVETPRWQQAYGEDYHYTGQVNKALPLPASLEPLLAWAHSAIDPRLNGLLLNWYDGRLDHYIGAHRDSTTLMMPGAPIVTVSLGEERTFRLRPWKGKGYRDFRAADGAVFILPYATNEAWTHEVPHSARRRGRRISITLRAFQGGESASGRR